MEDPEPAPDEVRDTNPPAGDPSPEGSGERGPSIADGLEHAVDPSWVAASRIGSTIAAAAFAVPLFVGSGVVLVVLDDLPVWIRTLVVVLVLAACAVLAISATVLPAKRYRHLRYRVDPGGIGIRSGIWWRSETHVSRSRVQHTDVTQGPIARAFGIATLVVFTAGTEHARVSLEGLPEARAREIRDFLVGSREDDGV